MKKVIYTPSDSEVFNLYMCDVRKSEPLSDDEVSRLCSLIHEGGCAGKRALDKLVNANLRFAVFIAKQYMGLGNSLEDLIQDANIGLIEAAGLFDASRGVKFTSFASPYVKKNVIEGLQRNCNVIRRPKDYFDASSKYKQLCEDLCRTEMRKPTLAEFEEATDLTHEKALAFYSYITNSTCSLDEPFEESDATFGDFIAGSDSAELTLDKASLRAQLDSICNVLKPRTREILYDIFGINTGYSLTNVEIADKYQVDSEQIRKIKSRAIAKVRSRQLQCA